MSDTSGISEGYLLLIDVCRMADDQRHIAYSHLRKQVERMCRDLTEDEGLQMTDLSARLNFVSTKLHLTPHEQYELHSFRLRSNAVLNHQSQGSRHDLLCDVRTVAHFIKRVTLQDFPAGLLVLLPEEDKTGRNSSAKDQPVAGQVRRMRVHFLHADEQYLYVMPVETPAPEPLQVKYNLPKVNDEFADTCRLLWQHAQLNLLDVRMEGGVLIPSFIILEPDYLLDISVLADCFKNYGHHPANYLLHRLQPMQVTRHQLLGNIVNMFLDDWIYSPNGTLDYRQCMQRAFHQYALALAACDDLRETEMEQQFFKDCYHHFVNLSNIVRKTFLEAGHELDSSNAILEPSYICEALGVQGRLDYMQCDMSAFIEMKSGKADEYALKGRVVPHEHHLVQMLLYQAVLEYSMGQSHQTVRPYLLYTRYPLLYPARASWAMLRRVMNVRNQIVACEHRIQREHNLACTAACLAQINSVTLNQRQLHTRLFTDYQAPQIDAFQHSLSSLSDVECKYFYALYTFLVRELYTTKSGDIEHEDSRGGAASLWQATLQEKREAGEIIDGLVITDCHADEEDPWVQFSYVAAPLYPPNFRQGDSVVLYERNANTDRVTNRLVFKASVSELGDCTLTLHLRQRQRNLSVLPTMSRYAIEHDVMDSSFRFMFQGLSLFLHANQERRDLLLCRREPRFNPAYDDAISHTDNEFQRIALRTLAARDYYLLSGPPGTGKTSHALRSMVETCLAGDRHVLLMAYTNRAVDEICHMLTCISPQPRFIRLGSRQNCASDYRSYMEQQVLSQCTNRMEVRQLMADCHVMVGTVSALSMRPELFQLKTFDVALIDEASQILEPQLLGLLCARGADGGNAIGSFVLVGDYRQLPAVVQQSPLRSLVNDAELQATGLRSLHDSLFERLCRQTFRSEAMPYASRAYGMLHAQGRMYPLIADFPNQAFYGGELTSVGLPHQTDCLPQPVEAASALEMAMSCRVAFFPSQVEASLSALKVNHDEARIAALLAREVYSHHVDDFQPDHTLGIIAPYRSQIALLRQTLLQMGIPELSRITIDTVERYQGSERDVIIYSMCLNRASQLHFLSNLTEVQGVQIDRKLNVALTRARRQLFITGVPRLMRLSPIYSKLLDSVEGSFTGI